MEKTGRKIFTVAQGAVAGAVATTVMSVVLEIGHRSTSFRRHAPTLIVRRILAGGPTQGVTAEEPLALMAHFGYGTSCGVLFALLTRHHRTAGPRLGVGYALLLWLISYAGWIPAAGVMAPPHRDNPGRQTTLVVGHVVYGAVMTTVLRRLRQRDDP